MVTMMPIITEPLALWLLIIPNGPCIINALTAHINFYLGATKLMVIRPQYVQVPTTESRIWFGIQLKGGVGG